MTTITEDYVSFETAKLLKEKGFDENCAALYDLGDGEFRGKQAGYVFNNSQWDRFITAPTHQMVMKWLREIHNKNIIFNMIPKGNDCYVLWTFNILSNKNYKIIWGTKQPKYNTYEEACEAAIKYCLENLI